MRFVALVAGFLLWAGGASAQCIGPAGVPFNCAVGTAPALTDIVQAGSTTGVQSGHTIRYTLSQILGLLQNPAFTTLTTTGNATIGGTLGVAGAANLSLPGVFTNTQSNTGLTIDLNGLDMGAAFRAQQGGNNATSAVSAGVLVPSTSTVYQVNAMAGFIQSNAAAVSTGGYVGGYFQAVATANSANMFGINTLAADTAGLTGVHLQNELDFNVANAGTVVSGLNMYLAGSATPSTANAYSVLVAAGFSGSWGTAFTSGDNASFDGISLGTQNTHNPTLPSQPASFRSYIASGATVTGQVYTDTYGNFVVRPGVNDGSFVFQDYNGGAGTNLATVSKSGLSMFVPLITTTATPASSSATCTTGQIEFDSAYVYMCVATNTWRRAASSAF